jgi:hypothetical protein
MICEKWYAKNDMQKIEDIRWKIRNVNIMEFCPNPANPKVSSESSGTVGFSKI